MKPVIPTEDLLTLPLGKDLLQSFKQKFLASKNYTIIQVDHKGLNPYANYQLSDWERGSIGDPAASYLENFKIEITNSQHQSFTISKIYQSWPNCHEFLVPVPLPQYFERKPFPDDLSFLNEKPTVQGLKQAEALLLEKKVNYKQMKRGIYFPLPIEDKGRLSGIIYLIYDLADINESALTAFQEKLHEKYSSTRPSVPSSP